MEFASRHWIAAGFAVVLAGATAVPAAAVAAPLPDLSDFQTRAVQLTGAQDVTWEQVLQTALTNATDIYDHFSPAPFPDVQQFIVNLPAYLDGTRNISTDLMSAGNAAFVPFTPANPEPYIYPSLDPSPSTIGISALGTHLFNIDLLGKADLLNILTNGLKFDIGFCPLCVHVNIPVLELLLGSNLASQVEPYLNFTGSPLSGILMGDIGTTLGPVLQLNDDITSIVAALSGPNPDYTTAFNDLLNIPANVTNALLNGYGDLNLAPASGPSGVVDLGGLLSPGGSLINALGFTDTLGDCSIGCATFEVPSTAVGPIASMVELSQAIAESIGWDGVGNPLASLF